MNWKPTLLKSLGSIIITVVINIIFWYLMPSTMINTYGGTGTYYPHNLIFALLNMISPLGVSYLIVSIILSYIIWSLFEKRGKNKK